MLALNFAFADGTPIEVMSAFWQASNAWLTKRIDSKILDVVSDDTTINIYVNYGDLPDAALAGFCPGMTRFEYNDFLNQYNTDSSSLDNASTARYLDPATPF